ncbi:MAG: DNA repair protein RecN [Bacteroidota bacterium]|nr:DNA repair protein RecN [Bacteroidota bacterium]
MLIKLFIENYALIDRLEIDFSPGFSVITGETGAGKSILLGALSLILGQRAETSILQNKSQKCVVEGSFSISEYGLENFFRENDLDFERTAILRREISPSGKSRAFINDTPVGLNLLKDLGDRLVNIHSQNSVITLNDANFQLAVVDSYAGIHAQVDEYRLLYSGYRKLSGELSRLKEEESRAKSDRDYYQFQFQELHTAALSNGEQEDSEQKLEILTHSEEIKTHLICSTDLLSEGEKNVLSQLSEISVHLRELSRFHPDMKELVERLSVNQIDLKDIASELIRLEESVTVEPEEIETLSTRLDLIYHLEKKHHVDSIGDLLQIQQKLDQRLQEVDSMEGRIKELESSLGEERKKLEARAGKISGLRKKAIPEIEKKICELLAKVGMPDAKVKIELLPLDEPGKDGSDKIRFLFSANKGMEPDEISRIASGGELSRLMLSIKSLISQKNILPTIIFDEIDIGVSGDVAGKVGNILRAMGRTMQVIAITHLPQIAGKGENHYWVYKVTDNELTHSMIKKLKKEERIHEIAKMLSNEKVTDAALKTAKELLLA